MVWTWQRTLADLTGATVPRSDYLLATDALRFANERIRVLGDRLRAANQLNDRLTFELQNALRNVDRLKTVVETNARLHSMIEALMNTIRNLSLRQDLTYDQQQLDMQQSSGVRVVDLDQEQQIDDLTRERDQLVQERDELLTQLDRYRNAMIDHEQQVIDLMEEREQLIQQREQLREQLRNAGILQ